MKFMVLMYADPAATAAMTPQGRADVFARHEGLHRDLADGGELRNGAGIALPQDTVTLRWQREAAPEVGSGPLIEPESGAHLTAYYVVECASLERAREIAERVLDFHVVAVEVRPIHDSFGMEEDGAS